MVSWFALYYNNLKIVLQCHCKPHRQIHRLTMFRQRPNRNKIHASLRNQR